MIAWMRGIVAERRPPRLVLEVNGIGYEIEAPMTTFEALGREVGQKAGIGRDRHDGAEIKLYIHQVIREDANNLYGFARIAERDTFRELLRVNGVGAKVALAILSGMNADALAQCVQFEDTSALIRLPGIGKKTAERLIIEMRGRLDTLSTVGVMTPPRAAPGSGASGDHADGEAASGDPVQEALMALVSLGFKPAEAMKRLQGMDVAGMTTEAIVRDALRAGAR